ERGRGGRLPPARSDQVEGGLEPASLAVQVRVHVRPSTMELDEAARLHSSTPHPVPPHVGGGEGSPGPVKRLRGIRRFYVTAGRGAASPVTGRKTRLRARAAASAGRAPNPSRWGFARWPGRTRPR